jgi:regulatory protein
MTNCRDAGPPPDAADPPGAPLDYLARYAATEVGLRRVLERRVDRWAARRSGCCGAQAAACTIARDVAARLVAAGAVNDAA